MRALPVVLSLLAMAMAAAPQEVALKDLSVTLVKTRPAEESTAIPIDEDGFGSVTIREPGEYELKLESKSEVTERYTVEADVGVNNRVALSGSTQQMIGGISFSEAPKLNIVEFAGPDSVVLQKLGAVNSGSVVRVKLVVKGPGSEEEDEPSER